MERYSYRAACLLAVSLLAAGLTACTTTEDTASPAGPVTESKGPVGQVPGGLDTFYGQSLTWGDCGPFGTSDEMRQSFDVQGAECARLRVPLDYARPDAETINLGVLRHKARDPDERIGSLVTNPGGPGASGMVSAASTGIQVRNNPIGQRFDVVGFDPRGVGASQPAVTCLTPAERDADRADDSEVDGTPEGVARQEASEREFGEKCAERTEYGAKMLANLGTRDVVKDMDVLRSALGDEKLSYLGYSYGTRIGYAYAEAFPGNVRSLVLDGALDPEQDSVESLVGQGEGFGVAFGEFASWCAEQQDCALGGDAAGATQAFQRLAQPLIDNPARVGDGRSLSFEDATIAAVQALYSQQLWEPLNTGLNELKTGKGDTLMLLADTYNERGADGGYATTQDAFAAIRCVDDPRVTDKAKIREAQRRYAEVAPFLDDGRPDGDALDSCAFWPVPNTSEPHLPSVQGVPPALVVSTTNDPATPYQAGVNLAKAMKGSLLTYEGTQHTIFLQGNPCVDDAGIAYLLDGTLPAEGTRCSG
ncbi:alpha/beta hydrolase [Amycolatopsis antarctica]|uniref:Alpha/beta hydrolase n=1 Tax=Amycolatopsis antarctica TaxID=1854586 RepID=A0A263DBJ3_9PSEU|nr:alpha/beta hydrolase [Amycolatopsis antarctica]OZM75348.1 alpha/beta hydrolase [Amycolatopsis antarctica]